MNTTLRIAVADDEPDTQEYFEKFLPRLGHEVVSVADNGRQLVKQCREVKPDLVITDIKMPEMDGIEAVAEISHERTIPVILVHKTHELLSLDTPPPRRHGIIREPSRCCRIVY